MPLSPACSAMLCTHSIDAEPAFAPSASMQHRSCIAPALVLHRSCTRAASFLHRCLRMLAFACIDACVCLHSPASMLTYACIRLHRCLRMLASPCTRAASMLTHACIRLHRSCIRAASLLHRCLRVLAFFCIDAAPVQHPCCIVPASFLHPCSTRAASLLHPCCIVPASMLAYACIRLHRSCTRAASMLAYACIRLHRSCTRAAPVLHRSCIDAYACLHSPASMLAYACIRLHRCLRQRCIASAFACIEPNRPKAKRAGSFDSLTRESSRRARRVTAREERERGRTPVPSPSLLRSFPSLRRLPCRLPVPPPSSFVLSSPSRPSSILSRSSIACLVACLVLRHPSRPCLAVALVGCAARFLTPVVQWNWRRGKPSPKLSGIGPHGTTVIAWLLRGNPPQGFKSRRPASPVSCHSTTHV